MMLSDRLMKIKVRRNIDRDVRPEVEQVDGKVFMFSYGWLMDNDDPYPGEVAWLPDDTNYPVSAPTWIASGDLEEEKP